MEENRMNWLVPVGIIAIILVVSGLAFLNISNKDKDKDNDNDSTPTPTATATATPSGTTSATPTATPSGSTTPTTTPVTTDPGDIEGETNAAWVAGVTTQTVGSDEYTIDGTELKKNDITVYTSSNGDIEMFYVDGGSIYIVEGRNSSTNQSRFIKYTVSSKKVGLIYRFEAVRVEINSFLFNKNDAKQHFFTISPVDQSLKPQVVYTKDFKIEWQKTFTSSANGDRLQLRALSDDSTVVYMQLVSGSSSKLVQIDFDLD